MRIKINHKKEMKLKHVEKLQSEFKGQWFNIKNNKRIEIHINSMSYDEFQ